MTGDAKIIIGFVILRSEDFLGVINFVVTFLGVKYFGEDFFGWANGITFLC